MRHAQTYVKYEPGASEPVILHQTVTPEIDELDRVRFDVRSSGKDAHLSSTMYLERKFRVQIQIPSKSRRKRASTIGGKPKRRRCH